VEFLAAGLLQFIRNLRAEIWLYNKTSFLEPGLFVKKYFEKEEK